MPSVEVFINLITQLNIDNFYWSAYLSTTYIKQMLFSTDSSLGEGGYLRLKLNVDVPASYQKFDFLYTNFCTQLPTHHWTNFDRKVKLGGFFLFVCLFLQ